MMPLTSAFSLAFAQALQGASTDAAGVSTEVVCESRTASPGNDPVKLSASLTIAVRFAGDVQGTVFVCPEEAASRQMLGSADLAQTDEVSATWRTLCQDAAQRITAALPMQLGVFHVEDCRVVRLPEDAEPLSDVICGKGDDAGGMVYLLGDSGLCAGLARRQTSGSALGEAMSLTPAGAVQNAPLERVIDVPLSVTLRFGQRQLTVRELLELNTGSLVELDQQVEEPVYLMLGERVIARGEVVIVDGNYGMRVLDVVEHPGQRLASLDRQ